MMGRNHLLMHLLYIYILAQLLFAVDPLTALVTLDYGGLMHDIGKVVGFVEKNYLLVAIFLLLWFDSARAPDSDLGAGDTSPVKSFLGFIGYEIVSLMGEAGHRGRYHTLTGALVTAGIGTGVFIAFYVLGDMLGVGVSRITFMQSIMFYVMVFATIFASFTLHLVEDALTVMGVRIAGRHVHGVLHTGVDDDEYALGTVLLVIGTGLLVGVLTRDVYLVVAGETASLVTAILMALIR